MSSGKFDLDAVCDLILKHSFHRVALQFPDEFLANCISIYSYIIDRIANDSIDVFIIGDSTYGSSIDDISAQHVDSDVLVYFGSDLSSSGSIPVIVVPFSKEIDAEHCIQILNDTLTLQGIDLSSPILLLYELSYSKAIHSSKHITDMINITIAELPPSANLSYWDPTASQLTQTVTEDNRTKVGGLLISSNLLNNPNLVIWYIGEKEEQLISINIRMSENMIFSYNPKIKSHQILKGCESREFRERYGGLLRVKDAEIIGIIVGSMGLNGDVTQAIVSRLQCLIKAAKKNSYVFVMGRLNEAKLCNFPEIDIFCLISNEDVALIKPKTFHVPVVTPWEIELGLGGRDWQGIFRSDSTSILYDVTLEDAVQKVISALPEDPIDSDSDVDIADIEDIKINNTISTSISTPTLVSNETAKNEDKNAALINGKNEDLNGIINNLQVSENETALTLLNSERSIVAFSSPAAEYFTSREFQGLVPMVPEGQDTAIQQGQFGIAKTYKKYEKNPENKPEKNPDP